MAAHISRDVLDGNVPATVKIERGGVFQPAKGSRKELAEEYARNLLPSVRSRLIARDADGRNVL